MKVNVYSINGEVKEDIELPAIFDEVYIMEIGQGEQSYTYVYEKDIEKAIETNASIIGLSALMTTTMQEMKRVIEYAKEQKAEAKVMIGGAVITQDYADEIGADGYSKDAAEAVKMAKHILQIED